MLKLISFLMMGTGALFGLLTTMLATSESGRDFWEPMTRHEWFTLVWTLHPTLYLITVFFVVGGFLCLLLSMGLKRWNEVSFLFKRR